MSRRSGRNNHLGSDDGVQPFQTIGEPARYEFQSYLSDDEEIPDDEPPLIATEGIEADHSEHDSSPEPSAKRHRSGSPLPTKRAIAKNTKSRSETPLLNGSSSSHVNGLSNGSTSGANATPSLIGTTSANEFATEVDTDGENLIKMTEIEVAIDWMPLEERATFDHVEVPDYEPEPVPVGHYSPRRLRTRRKVRSAYFFTASARHADRCCTSMLGCDVFGSWGVRDASLKVKHRPVWIMRYGLRSRQVSSVFCGRVLEQLTKDESKARWEVEGQASWGFSIPGPGPGGAPAWKPHGLRRSSAVKPRCGLVGSQRCDCRGQGPL